jgi:hypothetical protein
MAITEAVRGLIIGLVVATLAGVIFTFMLGVCLGMRKPLKRLYRKILYANNN